jgi:hypothetical protein
MDQSITDWCAGGIVDLVIAMVLTPGAKEQKRKRERERIATLRAKQRWTKKLEARQHEARKRHVAIPSTCSPWDREKTHLNDITNLYEIATKLIPAYNRSKNENRKELMHSFGVKQLGMGENQSPILLKMNECELYADFQILATLYYGKQEILERLVAPKNHACRKEMKDELLEGACCAIPGAESVLVALACSNTHDYAPDLHTDTPLDGTLECIVFSESDEAVFALKHGGVEVIVPLRAPMLILLDSKQCLHATQRTEVAARAAFREADGVAPTH